MNFTIPMLPSELLALNPFQEGVGKVLHNIMYVNTMEIVSVTMLNPSGFFLY